MKCCILMLQIVSSSLPPFQDIPSNSDASISSDRFEEKVNTRPFCTVIAIINHTSIHNPSPAHPESCHISPRQRGMGKPFSSHRCNPSIIRSSCYHPSNRTKVNVGEYTHRLDDTCTQSNPFFSDFILFLFPVLHLRNPRLPLEDSTRDGFRMGQVCTAHTHGSSPIQLQN